MTTGSGSSAYSNMVYGSARCYVVSPRHAKSAPSASRVAHSSRFGDSRGRGRVGRSLVIIEFPTLQAGQQWYASPGYQAILQLRTRRSISVAAFVEAVPPGYRAVDAVAALFPPQTA
jgi:uncharacterized protein (DUF1330 family)